MSEVTEYIDTMRTKYPFLHFKIRDVVEPTLNENYGTINIIHVNHQESNKNQLIVIPGYSFKSFTSMTNILLEGSIASEKYNIFIINWGDKIKELSTLVTKDIEKEEDKYKANEDFRMKMANILDKILRSDDMGFIQEGTNISLLGKSAGGGVALYIASVNHYVNKLYLCAPATTTNGTLVKDRKDLDIKISWNKDDNMIPFEKLNDFIIDFNNQHNRYTQYTYESGGHELNPLFVKEL